MDFVGAGGGIGSSAGAGNGGLASENGPILYSEPNRTSAIDDIRSVVIYIFIVTIFVSFFLILPGIRNEKFPTFLCITTSLIVTSIILVSLLGTTWHVGEAPISAAYKAFSRDRIQGELSVRIGLQSVNITLIAHKYYILHASNGPIIMSNINSRSSISADQVAAASSSILNTDSRSSASPEKGESLAEELLGEDKSSSGSMVDTELESEEVFEGSVSSSRRLTRSSSANSSAANRREAEAGNNQAAVRAGKRNISTRAIESQQKPTRLDGKLSGQSEPNLQQQQQAQKYTIERVNIDINYNERFYWIEPNQMRQEHQSALERGLPYPILTVVEYLSQDEAGFSWSRQYRLAGYYSYIILWLSLCVCILMFFLHCAAPKYGIYTMQLLGCLLLFTNFTYATLVPRGEQKLVIPFEGQSLTFKFGFNFWLVMIGGCLSFFVGSLIVIIDSLFPNFIFTTILDVDFDAHHNYYKHRRRQKETKQLEGRPIKPPFLELADQQQQTKGGPKKLVQLDKTSLATICPPDSVNTTLPPAKLRANNGDTLAKVRANEGSPSQRRSTPIGQTHQLGAGANYNTILPDGQRREARHFLPSSNSESNSRQPPEDASQTRDRFEGRSQTSSAGKKQPYRPNIGDHSARTPTKANANDRDHQQDNYHLNVRL